MFDRRILLLSYFEPDDVPKLIRAIRATATPPGTRIYVGSYGVNGPVARQVQELERGRYAPMFPIKPTSFWNRRRVPGADEPRYEGKIPPLTTLMRLPSRERLAWGRELGRRFRDEMRLAENEVRTDAWQLDELVAELSGSQGRQWREFTRGALHGLNFGRLEFGDGPRIGFVWASLAALRVASLNVDAELRAVWRALDSATFRLAGEEYPPFVGNPEDAAEEWAWGFRLLARSRGDIRKRLAQRYLIGMTPGWHLARGLGGNVGRRPRAEVNRWRAKYVDQRERIGAAGFGAYHFRFENSSEQVMRDTLAGLARGLG